MKMIRSFIFGGLAMLAAAICMSAPATAVEYSPPDYMLEVTSFEFVVPDAIKTDAVQLAVLTQPERSTSSHGVEYIIQNQPHSAFRQLVDAYQHIDPHIGLYV